MFKAGDSVTWGSGSISAAVVEVFKAFNPELGAQDVYARVKLTKPAPSPCGKTFPVGTETKLPTVDLRPLC